MARIPEREGLRLGTGRWRGRAYDGSRVGRVGRGGLADPAV